MVECLRDLGLLTLKTEGVRDQLIPAMMGAPSAPGPAAAPAPGEESPGVAGQEPQDASPCTGRATLWRPRPPLTRGWRSGRPTSI